MCSLNAQNNIKCFCVWQEIKLLSSSYPHTFNWVSFIYPSHLPRKENNMCTADLLFDWIGFNQAILIVSIATKPVKLGVSDTTSPNGSKCCPV